MEKFKGKSFLGIVEDNNDPDRQNRCRIRVINVFDNIPTEDIPWAIPRLSGDGNSSVPANGKVVSVEFEDGDIYSPVYKYMEHQNVNLEEKLKDLSEEDYLSMKSQWFDHKTQMYVNESEGFKIDHKFNLFNITEDSIDVNLKDNFGSVNIGASDASQQAILGNHFLDWFDKFVDHLLGSEGGPYMGNLLSPVVPHPGLITHLLQYKALKEPKFLSHNINLNDNGYIDKLTRINIAQKGDSWDSTTDDNNLTNREESSSYVPKNGTKESTPSGILTTSEELDGQAIDTFDEESFIEGTNKDVLALIYVLRSKNYEVYEEPFKLNIVGVRYQYPNQKYSNRFKDRLYVFYKDNEDRWHIKNFKISTIPGAKIRISKVKYNKFKDGVDPSVIGQTISLKKYVNYIGRSGLGILKPAQYINTFQKGYFPSSGKYKEMALRAVSNQIAYRDNKWDSDLINYSFEEEGMFYMHIHRGYPGGELVNNWSEGCQVFRSKKDISTFEKFVDKHIENHNNQFTYTLITSDDYDKGVRFVED